MGSIIVIFTDNFPVANVTSFGVSSSSSSDITSSSNVKVSVSKSESTDPKTPRTVFSCSRSISNPVPSTLTHLVHGPLGFSGGL